MLHKQRRRVLGSFFSRQSVVKLGPLVENAVEKLCNRLREAKEDSKPIKISLIYRCMTADIITDCLLSWSYGFLDRLEDGEHFLAAFDFSILFMIREVPYFFQALEAIASLAAVLSGSKRNVPSFIKWRLVCFFKT